MAFIRGSFAIGRYTYNDGSRYSWFVRTPWFGILYFNCAPDFNGPWRWATGIEIGWRRNPIPGAWFFLERRSRIEHVQMEGR